MAFKRVIMEFEVPYKPARNLTFLAAARREISLSTKADRSKKTYSRKIKHKSKMLDY